MSEKILAATGIESLDAELEKILPGHGMILVNACYHKAVLERVIEITGADTVIISPDLPGDGDLIEIAYNLRVNKGKRVVVLAGDMRLEETRKLIARLASMHIYDFLYNTGSRKVKAKDVVKKLLNPSDVSDIPSEVRDAVEIGKGRAYADISEKIDKTVEEATESDDKKNLPGLIKKMFSRQSHQGKKVDNLHLTEVPENKTKQPVEPITESATCSTIRLAEPEKPASLLEEVSVKAPIQKKETPVFQGFQKVPEETSAAHELKESPVGPPIVQEEVLSAADYSSAARWDIQTLDESNEVNRNSILNRLSGTAGRILKLPIISKKGVDDSGKIVTEPFSSLKQISSETELHNSKALMDLAANLKFTSPANFCPDEPGDNAKRDELTGCFLRDVLNDYKLQPNSSIIFLDLDNFKPVNDNHGHAAGDALLRAFGQHLIVSVRPGDLVVRYGGDEFVIILENVSLQGAESISRRISECWQGIDYEGRFLRTGVSIGIAQEGVHGNSLEELINTADKAMYRGKKSGKNKLVIAGGAQVRAIGASNEKIFGTVTICVAGAEKGVGTTHTALSIASFLARNKLSVAVAELPDPSPSSSLPSEYDLLGRTLQDKITVLERNCYRYKNIDFYFVDSESKKSKYLDVFNKNYKYIILDLGFIKPREEGLHKFITEMMRSTLSILVASATPWKGSVLAHILRSAKDVPDLAGFRNWRIVFTAPDEGYYNQYRKALTSEKIESVLFPYHANPFIKDEERDSLLFNLLAPVLEKTKKTRNRGWVPFVKNGP